MASVQNFERPTPMVWDGTNPVMEWKRFMREVNIYLDASGLNNIGQKRKVAILLNFIGAEGRKIFDTFDFVDDSQRNDFDLVVKKFEAYCQPLKNIIFERFKFMSRKQKTGESVDQWVVQLKHLIKTCEFDVLEEDMLVMTIVLGIKDVKVQHKLLKMPNLNLKTCMETIKIAETSGQQVKDIQEDRKAEEVDNVNKIGSTKFLSTKKSFDCDRCGTRHGVRECPAYNKECFACGRLGHFASLCKPPRDVDRRGRSQGQAGGQRSTKSQNRSGSKFRSQRNTDYVDNSEDDDEGDSKSTDSVLFVREVVMEQSVDKVAVSDQQAVRGECFRDIYVNNKYFNVKLDTGSQANTIPLNMMDQINIKESDLKPTNVILRAYGGAKLDVAGCVDLICSKDEKSDSVFLRFYAVRSPCKPLLSLAGCLALNLVKIVDDVSVGPEKDFPEVFQGVGKVPGKVHINVDDSVQPVVSGCYRVPYSIQPKLKKSLDKLVSKKIIEKVREPTDWVSNLVIAEKPNGNLRLCIDPKHLNKAIKREHFPIPKLDDVIAKMSNKSVFSTMDQRDGFYQISLDEESSYLCTFVTVFGRYRFLRLPFGVKSAPEIFQRMNFEIFGDLEGVIIYFDDFILFSHTVEEHDVILRKVLQRAKEYNIKFNPEKCKFRQKSVKFLGHVFTSDGIQIDYDRIKAINLFPQPKCKKDVERFLGMIAYVSRFIPNVSEKTAILRNLTKQDTIWSWGPNETNCFQDLKNSLIEAPVLRYFDPEKDIVIQTDASSQGLGSCLLQDGHPIAYASRALTEDEKTWFQIEKELLAVVYACEKFHQFVYGRQIIVHSDHKPLESIVNKKQISQTTARIQIMLLRLLKYNIDLQYVPGKEMLLADALSRAYLNEAVEDNTEVALAVHLVSKYLSMSDKSKILFREETAKDPCLKLISNYTKEGWPQSKDKVDPLCKPFYNLQTDITEHDGLLFHGDKVIVPSSLRKRMLDLVHESHFGFSKTLSLARTMLYWPGMAQEIKDKVESCMVCLQHKRKNSSEPLIPHEVPKFAWQKVGLDIAEYNNKIYLVFKDYYSKWISAVELSGKSIKLITTACKSVFSHFGIPEQTVSDNSPFNADEFRAFCDSVNIDPQFISPTHSQSNGMAESGVKVVKTILKKTGDLFIGLLNYNNSVVEGLDCTPAQLMLNKNLRTKIPSVANNFKPQLISQVPDKLIQLQARQKKYYDRSASPLAPFKVNDKILMRVDKRWEPGVVIRVCRVPRTYIVKVNDGTYKRNRVHLRANTSLSNDFEASDNGTTVNVSRSSRGMSKDISVAPNGSEDGRCKRVRFPKRLNDYYYYS